VRAPTRCFHAFTIASTPFTELWLNRIAEASSVVAATAAPFAAAAAPAPSAAAALLATNAAMMISEVPIVAAMFAVASATCCVCAENSWTECGLPRSKSARLMGCRSEAMSSQELLYPEDLDVHAPYPEGLVRIVKQGLVDLTPWHVMDRDLAKQRLLGLRERYRQKYVPFAWRQDNDDIACLEAERPGGIVIVHDFASEGFERRQEFDSFWDWFRSAIEDMIDFE
jgi:hypothetical protein